MQATATGTLANTHPRLIADVDRSSSRAHRWSGRFGPWAKLAAVRESHATGGEARGAGASDLTRSLQVYQRDDHGRYGCISVGKMGVLWASQTIPLRLPSGGRTNREIASELVIAFDDTDTRDGESVIGYRPEQSP